MLDCFITDGFLFHVDRDVALDMEIKYSIRCPENCPKTEPFVSLHHEASIWGHLAPNHADITCQAFAVCLDTPVF